MVKRKDKVSSSESIGFINFIVWFVGVLVGLAVGFGMVDGVLSIRFIPEIITVIAGWIVVGFTLFGALFRIFGKL
jgi:hypothetical protein